MSQAISIPVMAVPRSEAATRTPNETYQIRFNTLGATLSIDHWFYCTEFKVAFDLTKVPRSTDPNDAYCHKMTENALVERANHDIAEMTLHYRLALAALIKCTTIEEERLGDKLGTRQCADIHSTCYIPNVVINIAKLYFYSPSAMKIGPNGILLHLGESARQLVSPQDGTALMKFSLEEYQKLEQNEASHRRYNTQIDGRICVNEDMHDTWSVNRAKVYLYANGRMVMTGPVNRRSVINAYSIVLQTLDQFKCIEPLK